MSEGKIIAQGNYDKIRKDHPNIFDKILKEKSKQNKKDENTKEE